jgi:hypothetical protein
MHGLIFETSICYWQDKPGSDGGVWVQHTEQGWISPALAVVVPRMVSRSQPSTPSKGYKNEVLEKKSTD